MIQPCSASCRIPGVREILLLSCSLLVHVCVHSQVPVPEHVVIVIEENHDFSQIMDSSAAPYINSLAAGSNAALFTRSFGLTHPSQPNYIMFFSGADQGVTNNDVPSGLPFTTPNLGAALIASGRTFAGYSEDLPYVGSDEEVSGSYARKHNPWVNWQNSPKNGIPDSVNLPLSQFPETYSSLPAVSIVIPNLDNDMHNGTDPETITIGDAWLRNHFDGYIRWAATHQSLFILTFDEGTSTGDNRIATMFIGSMVKRGPYNDTVNHFTLLRTLEAMFRLPPINANISEVPITQCWIPYTALNPVRQYASCEFLLCQNFPNPFNPSTKIGYRVSGLEASKNSTEYGAPGASDEGSGVWGLGSRWVRLSVYDILGREVAMLVNEPKSAGSYEVQWNAAGLPSGVYVCRMSAGNYSETRRMILLK
jgi:hypothetical protein